MGFSALRRYESQKAAYDAYKLWQAKTPAQKQADFAAITDETKRSKPERQNGYLSPFNQIGLALKYVELRVLMSAQSGQGSDVANSLKTALDNFYIDGTETVPIGGAILYPRFKAARLAYTAKTTFSKKNSRITGRAYLKPDVDTVSAPFGQSVGGQTYEAALLLIKTAADTWAEAATAPAKRSYKFFPEGA
jgi:hypothetical protein